MFTWKAIYYLEPTVTNVHPVFTSKQLAENPGARRMEDPTPSNTLDHDALAESITTACVEDDLTMKIWKRIKTANQLEGRTEKQGCLLYSFVSEYTCQTRGHYGYTPSATTMTTPQQDTSERPRPWSWYAISSIGPA